MKVVVDDKIPYIKGKIEKLVQDVLYLPGAEITPSDVRDADIMIIRTRTKCNRQLLQGSKVRLVVTATIGYDHIDTSYMDEAGIEWHNCPGCNATSVAQYVRNSLLLLQQERGVNLQDSTLGIVGVGHVGREVLKACRPLVGRVLLNDPPRQQKEGDEGFCSLATLRQQCNIITIHTPLVRDGEFPSFHLIDETFMAQLAHPIVLINCGRGEVVDNVALLKAIDSGIMTDAIIDTWENEPDISRPLLEKVYIGTPHVAGYSADGKANATRMSMQHVAQWLSRQGDTTAQAVMDGLTIEPPALPEGTITTEHQPERELQLYDPRQDSQRLKSDPTQFEYLRGHYPLRREHV